MESQREKDIDFVWRTFIGFVSIGTIVLVLIAPAVLTIGLCISDSVAVEDWIARLPVVYFTMAIVILVNAAAVYPIITALRHTRRG